MGRDEDLSGWRGPRRARRPRAIATPGHTPGHASLMLEQQGALLAGDAIVSWNPYTGRSGRQIMSRAATGACDQALGSLDRIAATNAPIVLCGHRPAITVGAVAAVQAAEPPDRPNAPAAAAREFALLEAGGTVAVRATVAAISTTSQAGGRALVPQGVGGVGLVGEVQQSTDGVQQAASSGLPGSLIPKCT
ncbi:MAG: MBL fold metallo-hydrolase [Solirubrobacteraceae bacterium]